MASAEEGELTVVTLDDLPAVQDAFGDVYAGADYLYSTFHYIVQGTGAKAFMYKVNGELVAFVGTLLVDDGQSLVSVAARVKEEYRGLGVFGRFRQMVHDHFSDRTLYPKLCREMQTTVETDSQDSGAKTEKSAWRKISLKPSTKVAFRASSLSSLTLQEAPSRCVATLTQDDLQQLFSSDSSQWLHLFPQKRIVVASGPYSVMAENVRIILNGRLNTVFYGTTASGSSSQPRRLDAKFSLLSGGSYYTCSLGIFYFVDIFGIADNRDEVEDHLNRHLRRLKDDVASDLPGNVLFHVFALERLDEAVSNATRQLQTFSVGQFKNATMQLLDKDW